MNMQIMLNEISSQMVDLYVDLLMCVCNNNG